MIHENIKIPMKQNTVLLDTAIQNLQNSLSSNLLWLDKAFGRSYRLVEHRPDGGKWVYPAAYVGNDEYVSLVPNDRFGNFSWFDIYDPQDVKIMIQGLPQYIFRGALVFWYNVKSIYPDASALYTEEVKNEILALLTRPGIIKTRGRFIAKEIYERFENIYKGYTIEKIYNEHIYAEQEMASKDVEFFMYPYAGLRIEFEIITSELCPPSTI